VESPPSASLVQVVAGYAGIVVGATCIFAAILVWWRRQTFGFGGAVLCGVGVVLIGLSVWQTVEFEADKEKLSFKGAKQSIENAGEDANASAKRADRPNATDEDKRAAAEAQKRLDELKSKYVLTYGSQVCGSYC
jgi:hypothetical protein